MNRIKIIEGILIFIIMVLIGYASNVTMEIRKNAIVNEQISQESIPLYHLAVVSDDVNSYSWNSLVGGIESKCKDKEIVFETYSVNEVNNKDEVDKAFEKIMLTKVDGIIVRLSDNDIAREQILEAVGKGIKVVTIGNDSPESLRDAYVGTNKFNMGSMTAELLMKDHEQSQNVLLILGNEFAELSGASSNNYLNGLHEKLKSTGIINKLNVEHTSEKRAELIVNENVQSKKIDKIICTDPIDSLRAIRVLIDLNLVGEIQFIGSSDLPEIIQYIDKGTIYATVVENFEMMGSTSVEVLYQLLDQKRQSAYISIPIKIINKSTQSGVE